jgi:hypothetical protein
MSISPGEEFRHAATPTQGDEFRHTATPDQAMWRKLAHLAELDSGAVLTPGAGNNGGVAERRTASAGGITDMIQILDQQRQRDEQIQALNDRLDDIDRRTDAAVHAAQEQLAEIVRTANHAKDGRAVFADIDGTIYDEHGNVVAAEDIDRETWKPEGATWAIYQQAQQAFNDAVAVHEDIQQAQSDLANNSDDDALDAMTDRVNALAERTGGLAASGQLPGSGQILRSTSAAKSYDDRPLLGGVDPLRDPFAGAVVPTRPAVGIAPVEPDPDPKLAPG